MSEHKCAVEFSKNDLSLIEDILGEVRDKLRHYPDGEMDWDEDAVADFNAMDARFREAAKLSGWWWAR